MAFASFNISFQFENQSQPRKFSNAESFWSEYDRQRRELRAKSGVNASNEDTNITVEARERGLTKYFGRDLERHIFEAYGSHIFEAYGSRDLQGPPFVLRVTRISYGSAILSLDALNPAGLLDFFKDEDVFISVLEQFSMPAFADSLDKIKGQQYPTIIPELDVTVTLSRELSALFSKSKASKEPSSNADINKHLRLWTAMNTSLLIPVLLALVVLYCAFVGLMEERKAIAQRSDATLDRYNEFLQIVLTERDKSKPGPPTIEELEKRIEVLEKSRKSSGTITAGKHP